MKLMGKFITLIGVITITSGLVNASFRENTNVSNNQQAFS